MAIINKQHSCFMNHLVLASVLKLFKFSYNFNVGSLKHNFKVHKSFFITVYQFLVNVGFKVGTISRCLPTICPYSLLDFIKIEMVHPVCVDINQGRTPHLYPSGGGGVQIKAGSSRVIW